MRLGDVEGRRGAVDAGVVHEDVDPPELGPRALRHGREVGASRDVGRHDADAAPEPFHLRGGALGPGAVELGDDDVGPHPRQLERGGPTDAAARAGDDRDLSAELHRPGSLTRAPALSSGRSRRASRGPDPVERRRR